MITGLHTFASAKPLRALERPATVMYTLGCFFASYLCGSACGYYNYLKELRRRAGVLWAEAILISQAIP